MTSKPTITESDLSAFARLGEELARQAVAGAEQILRAHRPGENVSVHDYATAALELAEVAARARSVPSTFVDGYFTQRFLAGDAPDYRIPESVLPNTHGERQTRPMHLA